MNFKKIGVMTLCWALTTYNSFAMMQDESDGKSPSYVSYSVGGQDVDGVVTLSSSPQIFSPESMLTHQNQISSKKKDQVNVLLLNQEEDGIQEAPHPTIVTKKSDNSFVHKDFWQSYGRDVAKVGAGFLIGTLLTSSSLLAYLKATETTTLCPGGGQMNGSPLPVSPLSSTPLLYSDFSTPSSLGTKNMSEKDWENWDWAEDSDEYGESGEETSPHMIDGRNCSEKILQAMTNRLVKLESQINQLNFAISEREKNLTECARHKDLWESASQTLSKRVGFLKELSKDSITNGASNCRELGAAYLGNSIDLFRNSYFINL